MSNVFVLDNGGSILKSGLASDDSPINTHNAVMRAGSSKKVFVGDEMIATGAESSYVHARWWKRPHDRGIVVDWVLQQKIWDRAFYQTLTRKSSLKKQNNHEQSTVINNNDGHQAIEADFTDESFADYGLIYTQSPLIPPILQNIPHEVAFELYGVNSIYRCTPAYLMMRHQREISSPTSSINQSPCCIVVDSGYSFTHIIPFIDNKMIAEGVKRINVGGKLLDNYLKESISFRQWNVVDETYLMNHIKEQLCYVSLDFLGDLRTCKDTQEVVKHWVLPNQRGELGHVKATSEKTAEQVLTMNNERISIPELLFTPSNIGIPQAGIPEAIVQAVNSCPEEMHESLYANVLLCGGNTLFPNFRDRVYKDLRCLIPTEYELNVVLADDPVNGPWKGGASLGRNSEEYGAVCVTKEDFQEEGHKVCAKMFIN